MKDFKLDDEVRVLEMAIWGDIPVGTVDVITYVGSGGTVRVGYSVGNSFLGGAGGKLELVKPEHKCPNAPHVHQKEIIAWANGADIQAFSPWGGGGWQDTIRVPNWSPTAKYRVKPDVNPRLELLNEKLAELNKAVAFVKKEIGEL
jgi:hypothetical protein